MVLFLVQVIIDNVENMENYNLPELSKDWLESLERAKFQERCRRNIYERHYSSKMSYERFIYIGLLEQEITHHHIDAEYAKELLKKFDIDHPNDKYY